MRYHNIALACLTLAAAVRAEPPVEYSLGNGLRVRLVPAAKDEKVVVLLGVRAGFVEEPAGRPHLAHITEHLTVFDLPPREAKAVAEWSKTNAANGETMAGAMYFDLHVPPADADLALRVQAARLGAVAFSRATLQREIPRTLSEVDFVERSPVAAAGKFALAPFVQAAFHGRTDVPLRASTPKIAVEDVAAFHRRNFRPDRAALVVTGPFDTAAVRQAIDAHFDPIPRTAPVHMLPPLAPGERTADWDVATRHLILAWPAPLLNYADHPALTLVAVALAERLMTDTAFRALGDAMPQLNDTDGMFVVGVQAKPGVDLDAVKSQLFDRLAALAKPEVWTPANLDRLRASLGGMLGDGIDVDKVPLPPRVTRSMARANIELQRMLRVLAWGDLDAYRKRLATVTPDAARTAAARLTPASATVVRVQPAK